MKRLLTAALALSLLAGTAAVAQPYNHDNRDNHGRYDQARHGDHRGPAGHHWARGQRMPSTWYRNRGHYVDYRSHHLRAPPRGYQWVQTDDNNFAMVALTTGLIASIVAANH